MQKKNETTLILCGYKANKWTDTSFPQMGEEGCGSRNPTCFLLTCITIFSFGKAFCPLKIGAKKFTSVWEKGNEERGKKDGGLEESFRMVQAFKGPSNRPPSYQIHIKTNKLKMED